MIFIPAKIKCYNCDTTEDIKIEFRMGDQNNIPILDYDLPEGWQSRDINRGNYLPNSNFEHFCPEHIWKRK